MNPRRFFFLVLIGSACGLPFCAAKTTRTRPPPESDIASIETRHAAVELALKLAKIEEPAPLANNTLPKPFNPPGFGMTARPVAATAVAGPTRTFGDREILTALAARIQPQGTLSLGSRSLLNIGKKNLRVGDQLIVNYEGQDYTLELVSFDTTNFTLRLNHEEITRPITIKPGKNP